jgi:hypothetical protein
VHTRILIAGAWLLGAAAATGGSLLAVSALGEGISAPPGQQLSAVAVSQALASEAAERPTPRAPAQGGKKSPGTGPAATSPAARTPAPQAQTGAGGPGTVLASSGGTVLATCAAAGAYLQSWSPQQGFEAADVVRGPAATARVVFTSSGSAVTMLVSCSAGVPSATTQVTNADDGGDGNKGPGGGGQGGGGGDG